MVRLPTVPLKTPAGYACRKAEIAISLATGTAPKAAARFHSPRTACATMGASAGPTPATAKPTLRAP